MSNDAPSHRAEAALPDLLQALSGDHRGALDELFPLLYDELRLLAHCQRMRWRGDHTLDTTALLHESYLKLVQQKRLGTQDRTHFFALVATAMRHILTNYAEQKRALKRGGGVEPVSLGVMEERTVNVFTGETEDAADLLASLDVALRKLERLNPRTGRVVECRFYGGLSVEETAAALDISPRTVKRDWAFAQAWLRRELKEAI